MNLMCCTAYFGWFVGVSGIYFIVTPSSANGEILRIDAFTTENAFIFDDFRATRRLLNFRENAVVIEELNTTTKNTTLIGDFISRNNFTSR